MRHIEKRANRYYAVLTVPPDVRHIIGKLRFVQSTQTEDRAEATLRAAVLVAKWKAEITKARGQLPDPSATFWESIRQDYLKAQTEDLEENHDGGGVVALEVAEIIEAEARKVSDKEEAALMFKVATGQAPVRVPLAPLVLQWKASLRSAQKTIDQAYRDMTRMADHFAFLDKLTPQRVKEWTDKLLADGVTASSFERIGQGCRSFWSYLQQSGTKSVIDPCPFEGPFKLAQKQAVRTKTGRSGSSYTPKQLAALYKAAKDKKDDPLADLIALGAYTGARIEELCKLTKADVRDGVFVIGKSKTAAGVRECPIHPAVAPLVKRMLKASTDGYLVPSTADNQYGNRSGPLSQRFGHLKKSLGYGPEHVFHSTRNTLATMMERAGVPEGVAADVVGHEKKTMTYGLYSSGSGVKEKLDAISKVKFPGALSEPR